MAAKDQPTYKDFEPAVQSLIEDGCNILNVHLPGFRKEQIRVQVSSTGKLRIFGERPLGNNAWQRFRKELEIPSNCNTDAITAKYKGDTLHVRQPLHDGSKSKSDSEPPHTAAAPTAEQQSAKQRQDDDREKKGSLAANGEVEATRTRETKGTSAYIANEIMSRAGRLKEVIPTVSVKLILPILVAVLLFAFVKRLSSSM